MPHAFAAVTSTPTMTDDALAIATEREAVTFTPIITDEMI